MSLPIVITQPQKHRDKVNRIVDYCAKLDGSSVTVIQIHPDEDKSFETPYPKNRFACLQSDSLRKAALQFRGQTFIWIETDSTPLKPQWAIKLESEFNRLGKEFLLSADCHPPHDFIGGIGVYGPNTHWLLRWHYPYGAWDLYVRNELRELVAYTPFIQHSYGIYSMPGGQLRCDPHMFPRDSRILRKSSVIFHRDPTQSLIP